MRPATTPPLNGVRAHLFGSGPILNYTLKAQEILANDFGVAADVWSVTSYRELRREGLEVDRWNLLHPSDKPKRSYVEDILGNQGERDVFIAASDNVRNVPEMINRWVPGGLYALGTDGYGRSETRANLRRHFEVDAECIALATLYQLFRKGHIKPTVVQHAVEKLKINSEKLSPLMA